ncbi:4Fe-4S binding protein [bacterium]|nr:4Fe-4S binding protein [bacterium]
MYKKYVTLIALFAFTILSQGIENKYKVDSDKCIGCAQCVPICPIDAISMEKGRAVIDPSKCISCGLCSQTCPISAIYRDTTAQASKIIEDNSEVMSKNIEPSSLVEPTIAAQNTYDSIPKTEEITEYEETEYSKPVSEKEEKSDELETEKTPSNKPLLDSAKCISCGICARVCPTDAIKLIDGKPVIDSGKCILCGKCVKRCPTEALSMPKNE